MEPLRFDAWFSLTGIVLMERDKDARRLQRLRWPSTICWDNLELPIEDYFVALSGPYKREVEFVFICGIGWRRVECCVRFVLPFQFVSRAWSRYR